MLDGGTAVVRVIADASKLGPTIAASVKGSETAIGRFGSMVGSALTNPIVLAGAAVTGVVSKLGFEFEDAFTRIAAISNASAQDIENWRTQIMTLSGATAQSPRDLAEALYFLASAGLKTSQVFPALEASAQASAVGLGDVATIGRVVSQVLNAYAKTGITASKTTDILVAATRESTAETDQFGQTLGRLLPISARAGISFGELAGSLSSLSNIGLDVYEAATAMRAATQAIVAPGEKAANALDEIGLSAQDLLDAIHQKGLLGALQLLDRTIKGNTTSESEYLRTFRDIIPNIRALTGVLGLTGQNAAHVQEIFQKTTHATGDLGRALRTTQAGPAFQFRKALNDLRITGVDIGTHVLPVITDVLHILGPLLRIAADNATKLLVAFLAYKALSFVPVVLASIGASLQLIGATWDAAAIDAIGIRLTAIGAAGIKAGAGTFALAYALGDQNAAAQTSKTELRDLTNAAQIYYNGLKSGALGQREFNSYIAGSVPKLHGNQEAFRLAATTGISYSNALWSVNYAGDELNKHHHAVVKALNQTRQQVDQNTGSVKQATKAYQRWGFVTDKAFKDFKKGLLSSVTVAVGQFDHLSDAFKTTPAELQTQLRLAVQIAQRYHNDLKAIFGNKDLSRTQKRALASLPADQRDAYVRSGDAAKREILRNATRLAHLNGSIANDIAQPLKDNLKKGGREGGKNLMSGAANGIHAGVNSAAAAAYNAALIIVRWFNLGLGNQSPSKKGRQSGIWFVEGVILGLKSREAALNNAADHLVNVLTDALGKMRDKVGSLIDDLKQKLEGKSRQTILDAIAHNAGIAAARMAVEIARARVQQAREWQKMVKQAEKALDRLVQKFKDFKASIISGFDTFKDLGSLLTQQWSDYSDAMKQYQQDLADYQTALAEYNQNPTGEPPVAPTAPTAPNYSASIQDQVNQATMLASLLQQAAAAGLSQQLIAQFASQGASAIPVLQQLLANPALIAQLNQAYADIAKAAGETTSMLGDQYFGKAIADATAHLNEMVEGFKAYIHKLLELTATTGTFEDALKRILHLLNKNYGDSGGGGGGNNYNGRVNQRAMAGMQGTASNRAMEVTVHMPNYVGSREEAARIFRDELLRIGRQNGGTGL